MSLLSVKQQAIQLADRTKRDVRSQFGALCWRQTKNDVQVLLVTSKRTGRWIVPKGWPVDGETPVEAAVTEAWEEGGVTGKAKSICIGIYSYQKEFPDQPPLPCIVSLFPLKVKSVAKDWPEKSLRKRRWVNLAEAADMVQEPELGTILRGFDPNVL
jgi:8-oxo-dGTP pyrophosphatase MutT (NUDIX family)